MEDKIRPSEEQRWIIESKGNAIVVSNPGTGKTTTLALKVVQLLEEGVDPDDIVCITFTKKAKKEMYDAINRQGSDRFSAQVKKVHIHTFHSFAYERLLDSGQIDEIAVDENRIRYSIYKSFKDNKAFNYSKKYVIDEIVPAATNAIQYIKSFGVTPDRISIPEVSARLEQGHKDHIEKSSYTMEEMQAFLKYFTAAYKDYEESKQDAIDYTDMLIKFLERFDGPLFKHALIDEMQDMNKMEAEIASRVAENIFLVGDEKQAIFGFQGGSTEYLKGFQKRCKKMLLSTNRRSTNQILDYAKQYYLDRVVPDEEAKEDLEKFRSDKSGEMPLVVSTKAPHSNMLRLVRENPGKRIGILTRSNYQIVRISELLDAEEIPHKTTASKITAGKAKKHIVSFLEGMLHDDVKYKIQAALTVLSPYPLNEALELAETPDANREEGRGGPGLEKLKKWGCRMTADELDELFENTIFPICVAHGPGWFSTAVSIKQNIDQYLTFDFPTREGLFEYLTIGAEPGAGAEEGGRWDDGKTDAGEKTGEGGITVSTVHKAKGQEYDVVIYLPREIRGGRTKFIDIVKTAIMQSAGTDISSELEGEQFRLHFVALTRARERLAVITSDGKDFGIKGLCEMVEDESTEEGEAGPTAAEKEQARYREAYSMFVAGKLEESMSLLGQDGRDGWIEKQIADYFESLERLSYSGIAAKPSEFLKKIFRIPRAEDKSARFGRNFHRAMHDVLDGKQDAESIAQNYSSGEGDANEIMKKSIKNALDAIKTLESEYRNLEVYALEKGMEIPVKDMTSYDGDDLMFSGQIDVIFKHNSGYLIIDYKTDKKVSSKYASDHRKQLSAYKRLLSRAEGIPEDKIGTRIVYTSMTGSVNTGRNDCKIDRPRQDAYPKFEKDLQKVLEWKQDRSKFVDDLLEEDESMDSPYDAIMENLKRSRTSRMKS